MAIVALALQDGPLGVNSVLASLYPAFTALAAVVVVLRERPSTQETLGIGLATGAVVALAVRDPPVGDDTAGTSARPTIVIAVTLDRRHT